MPTEVNIPPATELTDLPIENQRQRWMKYGANVTLACVLAVLFTSGICYFGDRYHKRFDTRLTQVYALKPQTLNIIRDNPQHITITSFYTKAKAVQDQTGIQVAPAAVDQAQVVSDLLEEYKDKGKNIDVQIIDPNENRAAVNDLIEQVMTQYGGAVTKYKNFLADLPERYKQIEQTVNPEVEQINKLIPLAMQTRSDELIGTLQLIDRLLATLPADLKKSLEDIQERQKQRVPPYKEMTDGVAKEMSDVSRFIDDATGQFTANKDNTKIPQPIRDYMAGAIERLAAMHKIADGIAADVKNLGDLKLDRLRTALNEPNSILVRGPSDWQIISQEEVWGPAPPPTANESEIVGHRFAGEQAITSAILAVKNPHRHKVVFVRNGGAPVATPLRFVTQSGIYAILAQRLRAYNYEVYDRDLTGIWSARTKGMFGKEVSDAEIKDAVWVVYTQPSGSNSMEGMPGATIASRVMDHLKNGGSAMFLCMPSGEDMGLALNGFGIHVGYDYMCVHSPVPDTGADNDPVSQLVRSPFVFEISQWGDSPVTKPLGSLSGLLMAACPMNVHAAKDVVNGLFLPIPDYPAAPHSWARKFDPHDNRPVVFDASKGDLTGPLNAGAYAENTKSHSRVVVFGTPGVPFNNIVGEPDRELLKQHIYAQRFPGNSEVFMDSIFWLSHQDDLIAMSPAAMDVPRISDMSNGMQRFWHVGVLLFLFPGLVLIAGMLVYLNRTH